MKLFKVLVVALLLSFLHGCSGLFLASAGITTTMLLSSTGQVRSAGRVVDDMALWVSIKRDLVFNYKSLNAIDVTVHEARVLITGVLSDSDAKKLASEVVWKHEGVREVINDIQISNKGSSGSSISDTMITTQIKSSLIFTRGVQYNNYKITTVNGVVYLIGVASDEDELRKAVGIVGRVMGVKKVISYVRLRDSVLRGL